MTNFKLGGFNMRKKTRINRNTIPFLFLILIHVSMLLILFKQKNDKRTWILLLSNTGFAYLFEYIILIVFKAYTYKPYIMKKPYFDNLLGALLSQGFYGPITATFLTIFQKNWQWKFGFSLYFCLIEKLFIKLNVYKGNWWKPSYTFMALNLYFYISNGFYKALTSRKKWALFTSHYLSIQVISTTLLFFAAASRKFRMGRGYLHSWREHFIFLPLYSLISYSGFFTSSKSGIIYRLLYLLGCITVDLLLKWTGILKTNYNHRLGHVPFHFFMMFISRFLYKQIYNTK